MSANVLYTFDLEKASDLAQQGWVCKEKKEQYNMYWNMPELDPEYTTRVVYMCKRSILNVQKR